MSYLDTIRDIDQQIAKLTLARAALKNAYLVASFHTTKPVKKKSTLSAAGRLSIQRAQRARWAKKKREARKAA